VSVEVTYRSEIENIKVNCAITPIDILTVEPNDGEILFTVESQTRDVCLSLDDAERLAKELTKLVDSERRCTNRSAAHDGEVEYREIVSARATCAYDRDDVIEANPIPSTNSQARVAIVISRLRSEQGNVNLTPDDAIAWAEAVILIAQQVKREASKGEEKK